MIISVKGVSKFFGSISAVKDVSLEIASGEMVGLIGQNGAGKTTLMRLMTSYYLSTQGQIIIDGEDVTRRSLALRRKVGYLPENPPLYMNMSVYDYLKFAAQLKDVDSKRLKIQIDKVLSECDLQDVKNKIIGTLSKGYKQRVGIAQALVNDPPILILDEPTSGLDPVQVQQVRKLLKNVEQKRTVIVSTHILYELEQVVKRILIIKSGEIVADDSVTNLIATRQAANLEEAFLKIVT